MTELKKRHTTCRETGPGTARCLGEFLVVSLRVSCWSSLNATKLVWRLTDATKAKLGLYFSSCTTVVMEVAGATFLDEMLTTYSITSAVLVYDFPLWTRVGKVAFGFLKRRRRTYKSEKP